MLQESIQVPLLRLRITQNALQLSFFFFSLFLALLLSGLARFLSTIRQLFL